MQPAEVEFKPAELVLVLLISANWRFEPINFVNV